MFSIISLFSSIFSRAATIRDQYLKPLLRFNSRTSATITSDQLDQQAAISPHPTSQEQPSADPDHVMIMIPNHITGQDHDQKEDPESAVKIPKLEVVLTVALFMATTSTALIVNTVKPLHFSFLLIPYNTMLNLSMFIGVSLAIYCVIKMSSSTGSCTTSVEAASWVLRTLMGLGLTTILLALVLRGCMVQPVTSLRFAWTLFFLIMLLIFLLLCLWKRIS